MRGSKSILCVLLLPALVLGCKTRDQVAAKRIMDSSFKPRHSKLGRLSILAETEFTNLPGGSGPDSRGPGEGSFGKDFSVMVGFDHENARQWGNQPPSKEQAASVFEGLGSQADVQISRISVNGQSGTLVTTTALGWEKPEWIAIYFGSNGLSVHVQGHDARPVTREVCIQAIRSIRFDS